MALRRLRLLTSGESHGPGLSGILDGLPAGLRVSTAAVNEELIRRQHGYGSGRRMLIEQDRVTWTACGWSSLPAVPVSRSMRFE